MRKSYSNTELGFTLHVANLQCPDLSMPRILNGYGEFRASDLLRNIPLQQCAISRDFQFDFNAVVLCLYVVDSFAIVSFPINVINWYIFNYIKGNLLDSFRSGGMLSFQAL